MKKVLAVLFLLILQGDTNAQIRVRDKLISVCWLLSPNHVDSATALSDSLQFINTLDGKIADTLYLVNYCDSIFHYDDTVNFGGRIDFQRKKYFCFEPKTDSIIDTIQVGIASISGTFFRCGFWEYDRKNKQLLLYFSKTVGYYKNKPSNFMPPLVYNIDYISHWELLLVKQTMTSIKTHPKRIPRPPF